MACILNKVAFESRRQQTNIAKKDNFSKNLSSPTFFEITTTNFQEVLQGTYPESLR